MFFLKLKFFSHRKKTDVIRKRKQRKAVLCSASAGSLLSYLPSCSSSCSGCLKQHKPNSSSVSHSAKAANRPRSTKNTKTNPTVQMERLVTKNSKIQLLLQACLHSALHIAVDLLLPGKSSPAGALL